MQEDGSQGNTCHHTTDDHRHEVLSFTHQFERQTIRLFGDDVLCKHQHEVEGEDGKDSLHQEFHTQYLQGYHQQDAVDDDIRILQMESSGIIDDS